MQYGAKITINNNHGANSGREVPNSKRELTKISERQPNYAERSKMAEPPKYEYTKWKCFERLEYKT
jgi:hypothetical protein